MEHKNLLQLHIPSSSEVRDYMKRFNEVKASVLEPSDYVDIKGTKYIKRSGYEKLSRMFQFSVSILSSEWKKITASNKEILVFRIHLKLQAPNGMYVETTGVCSTDEKKVQDKPLFVLEQTAYSRAYSRGVRMLLGGVVASEEDIEEGEEDEIWGGEDENEEEEEEEGGEERELDPPATPKQVALLRRLQSEGKIPKNINLSSVSKREASKLIEEAIG